MSDAVLVRRLLAGDEAAFDEFFARYFPRLYRFALARLGGNGAAAEDVVQRVLIQAIRRLHTYRGEAALFTWLCSCCRREIGGWLARDGQGREVPLTDDRREIREALDALAAADMSNPEAVARRHELCDLVRSTLDHLPGRYGEVLEWKYMQGLSVDDIARRLGVGYKAAESLLTRARSAFRDGFSLMAGAEPDV
jgi:RNA polymerase sigma-70 factor (ECF subfamily)